MAQAEFYFYDNTGAFVTKGKVLSEFDWTDQGAGSNVESVSDAMVVLENVTVTPTQVLAVLNGGSVVGDLSGKNMTQAWAETISAYSYNANSHNYFVMTNSAYVSGGEVKWATPITTANLQSSPELAEANPVNIYVERVAAKVELDKDVNFKAVIDGDIQVDGADAELEVTVDGWGLSGTNKTAYCVKNIQNTTYWTGWNAESNYRSYWAEDPNYSTGTYPSNYDGWNAGQSNASLDYLTYNDLTNELDTDAAYCLENTMNEDVLNYDAVTGTLQDPAVTHLLIAATLKVKNNDVQTLYRYKGYFYTEANYKNVTLSDWMSSGDMIYTKTDGGQQTTYTPLAVSDITIQDNHEGKVNIALSEEALAKTWYRLTGYNPGAGTATGETAVEESELATLFEDLNDADGFKEGKMYYCVPIEHLNATKGEVGSYGVVRNHLYRLTLESIQNIGTAVYNPGEVIIPNYEPETYYVAAKLNILSWHIVSQSVNL